MQFVGKHIIVTGGTAGIGRAISLAFAKRGAHVAIVGTNKERALSVLGELETVKRQAEQQFVSILVDVSRSEDVEREFSQLIQSWGKIDVLVNNAGITRDGLLMRMPEEDWDAVVAVNLKSIYNTCRVLSRSMMKARSGKIINIGSVVGVMGNAGQTNYSAAKAGMIGFTKSLAKELASRNVCVNCVAPGYIQTQMTQVLPDRIKEEILSSILLNRIGEPEDVANLVLFLASDWANYITGQVICVDGGMCV